LHRSSRLGILLLRPLGLRTDCDVQPFAALLRNYGTCAFLQTRGNAISWPLHEECHMEVDRSRGRSSSVCLTFVSQRAEDQAQDAHRPRLIQWFVAAAAFR
jgi:hypothetical protein